jgi:membrane-associated phospholipid phosphatase
MNLRATRLALLLLLLLGAAPVRAQVTEPGDHGVFTGEQWRYRRVDLFPGLALRILADLVAIPSGVPWWQAPEWAVFGGVVGSTIVQFQSVLQREVLGVNHFRVWTTVGDVAIWSTVGAATVSLLVYGLVSGDAPATETAALMIEAFTVAQLYHQMIKLLVGRAGPNRPELEGQYLGPAASLQLWPSGTPSGHMASMYALLSVLMHYFDHPALWVGLNAAALVFGASLVGDDYHWVSDVILGAGLGFCVGRWVVQHRSTRFHGGQGPPSPALTVLPVVVPGSGAGLSLLVTF